MFTKKLIKAIDRLTEAVRILCEILARLTGDTIDWEDE